MDNESLKFLEIMNEQLNDIKLIDKDRKNMSRYKLETKWDSFAKKYPKTWLNIVDGNFIISHFERKLDLYISHYNRQTGNHYDKKFKADSNLGEDLAQEYLYPTTGIPSDEDKHIALALAAKKINGTTERKKIKFD